MQPAMSAGAIFITAMVCGTFQGMSAATMPTGSRVTSELPLAERRSDESGTR
jgi:hypothetical protein